MITLITKVLFVLCKLIVDIPEIRENLQCLQGFDTTSESQNALESHDAA